MENNNKKKERMKRNTDQTTKPKTEKQKTETPTTINKTKQEDQPTKRIVDSIAVSFKDP